MKQLLSFSLLLCFTASSLAQALDVEFSAGLLFEDSVYDTLARQATEDGAKAVLPPSIDLTPYCPEVRHQGHIMSCVGWATGYAAMSIQRAILNQCTDQAVITRNAHSALFLYNQIKKADCRQGARISDAMQFLQTKGDCLARQFDFNINDCSQQPDTSISAQARRFAIQDFMTLFHANANASEKIQRVKHALANKKTVIVGMSVLHNFYQLKNARYWHPELGNTTPAGGHAMVVVGYDDRREAFRLMNSWGKNWGDNGYIWIKYKAFGSFCKYGYVMHLLSENSHFVKHDTNTLHTDRPLSLLAASLQFRAFSGWAEQSGQALFTQEPVIAHGPNYRLSRKDWRPNQLFQLLATTTQKEQYLYIFSVDAHRKVHFHWPRQAKLNTDFAGQNDCGLLIAGGAEIAIPGPDRALKIVYPGTDRLVVLVSKRRIETIKKLADIVSGKDGDFTQNLLSVLGKYAVPPADITYLPDQIGFEAQTRSSGFIVPLILEVNCQLE